MSELPNRWIVEHDLTVHMPPAAADGGDGPMKPLLALIPFVAAILSLVALG
jgi:hypothetical protein